MVLMDNLIYIGYNLYSLDLDECQIKTTDFIKCMSKPIDDQFKPLFVTKVIDGDTISGYIKLNDSIIYKKKIRLAGIEEIIAERTSVSGIPIFSAF